MIYHTVQHVALVCSPLSDKSKPGSRERTASHRGYFNFYVTLLVMTYFEYGQRNLLIAAKAKARIGQIRMSRRRNMARNGVENGNEFILLHITCIIEQPENTG